MIPTNPSEFEVHAMHHRELLEKSRQARMLDELRGPSWQVRLSIAAADWLIRTGLHIRQRCAAGGVGLALETPQTGCR